MGGNYYTSKTSDKETTSSFAFTLGTIFKPFPYVSLTLGAGAGSYAQTDKYTVSATNNVKFAANQFNMIDWQRKWYFAPEAGLLLNFEAVSLSGSVKYPLLNNEIKSRPLFSAGIGIRTYDREYRAFYDESGYLSYLVGIPNPSSHHFGRNANLIGLSIDGFNLVYPVGFYASLRTNAMFWANAGNGIWNGLRKTGHTINIFGETKTDSQGYPTHEKVDFESSRYSKADLDKNDKNVDVSNFILTIGGNIRVVHPVYFSLGGGIFCQRLMNYDQKQIAHHTSWKLAPEAGLHFRVFEIVLLSLKCIVPKADFSYANMYYSLGIGFDFL
jgi:hypothetical protein